jgi:hypothetical protein
MLDKASFVDADEAHHISAVIAEFDYAGIASRLTTAIEKTIHSIRNPTECDVTVNGRRHDEQVGCENLSYDPLEGSEYCTMNRLRELELERESYKWLPSRLEFYWQSGIGMKGQQFLKTTGFVYQYK